MAAVHITFLPCQTRVPESSNECMHGAKICVSRGSFCGEPQTTLAASCCIATPSSISEDGLAWFILFCKVIHLESAKPSKNISIHP